MKLEKHDQKEKKIVNLNKKSLENKSGIKNTIPLRQMLDLVSLNTKKASLFYKYYNLIRTIKEKGLGAKNLTELLRNLMSNTAYNTKRTKYRFIKKLQKIELDLQRRQNEYDQAVKKAKEGQTDELKMVMEKIAKKRLMLYNQQKQTYLQADTKLQK